MEETPVKIEAKRSTLRKICSVFLPFIFITATASIFTLPVIFYSITQLETAYDDTPWANTTVPFDGNNATNCTHSWAEVPGNASKHHHHDCTAHSYSGKICRDFLSYWKKCVGIDGENNKCIYFNESRGTLIEREEQLEKIIYYLSLDSDCQKAALPFLCQYMFPLLDCTSDVIYTPSREDCIDIKSKTCAQLWKLAEGYGFGSVLPKCENLNLASATSSNHANNEMNESSTSSTPSNLTCRKGFYKANVICLPLCDEFEDSTSKTSEFILKAEVAASIFAMIISTVVLILSVFSYKTMFVYPSILIIFMTIDCGIVGLLGFIIALDRNKLMCSSKDLLESIKQSTPFCILSGAIFHYVIVNMSLWWLSHVCIFFYQIAFPFHANRTKMLHRNKYIYAIVTAACLILPLPAVIACLIVDEYGYKINRFPPTFCTSLNKEMWFHSFLLVVDVTVCIGACLLIAVCWILHKKKGLTRGTSTAEKKLILVFLAVIIFSISSLIHSSIYVAKADSKSEALNEYFKCEALGYVPGNCDEGKHERIIYPYINVIVYTTVNLVPLVTLIYVVKWAWIKKLYKYLYDKIFPKSKRRLQYASSVKNMITPSLKSVLSVL